MAGLNISLSLLGLNRRQTCSSEKITTWAYISFWFPPSAVVLPALYSFLHRQQTNETIPLQFPRCFYEKNTSRKPSSLNVCEVALQAASAYKRREFWREIHTSFASDWTYNFFSFLFLFFHVSKPSFVFAYENLRHSSLVSISQYVCLILLFGTVHVVCQIVSCISGYGWIRPLYIILAFFWAF